MAPDIQMARLKDHVTELRTSVNVPSFPQEWFAHFSLPAFDTGRIPVIEQGGAIQSAKLSVPTDCVLLSKLNPRIPRVWFPRYNGQFRAICSTEFLVLRPLTPLIPQYLYCVLSDPEFAEWHSAQASGTTGSHQRTSFASVSEWEFILPPVAEQRAIAHILGAIDDKIDLNRRMASTLEDMARALFTSWFVRFDPVRAKMAGLPTGLPAHIDALFPDALVDSELGDVPEGWGVGPLSSIASLARDTINPLHYPDETFAHFSLPAFDDGQLPLLERGALIQSNKFHLTDDVVLLTKLNPHIPRNWMAIRSATHRSVASTEFMPFRAVEGSSREFLYLLFDSVGFRPQYLSLVSGTTGSHQRVQPPAVLAIEIVLPPADIVGEFTRLVAPMLGEAVAMRARNQSLASLRDTLLPKLVSGEVRITDPEAFLRRAGLDTDA